MKIYFSIVLLIVFTSCQEDPKVRALEQAKESQKREAIFKTISKGWNFNSQPANETAKNLITVWAEWRVFLNELGQKPKSSISAFQQKAKTLSKKALDLNNNIPIKYDLPEVKSRIAVLTTKINAINLYIHLNKIPDTKIVQLVQEINTELEALQWQMDEVVVKSQIQIEEGESDLIKMMNTSRAIPNVPLNANQNIQ